MRTTGSTAFAAVTLVVAVLCAGPTWGGAARHSSKRAAAPAVAVSMETRRFAAWVIASGDSQAMPFVVIDKKNAEISVYYPDGRLRGAGPALLGLAKGDDSVPGIGQRKLSAIRPEERTTPAGRFVGSLGNDLGARNVVWVDYDAGISLHRVVTSNPKERRLQRLATSSPRDKRISYGCINVPAGFYDRVVEPTFTGASGIVYILPEVRSMQSVFPTYEANRVGN